MIKDYVKRPVKIQAIKWDGTNDSTRLVLEFMGREVADDGFLYLCQIARVKGLDIVTLEDGADGRAKHVASVGDYIIKGVQGEFYPCKPDIFEETYAPA